MLEALVASVLSISNPMERDAIDHAAQATSIQLGIEAELSKQRKQAEDFARKLAQDYGVSEPIGSALFIGQTVKNKSATVRLGNRSAVTVGIDRMSFTFSF